MKGARKPRGGGRTAAILASVFVFTALVACLAPIPTSERTRGPSPTLDATTLAKIPTATPPLPTTLVITISPIPPNIPDFDWTQWPHWTDQDGNCRNARQETLAAESVVPVTFETPDECRVASGEWRDPYTGIHEDDPRVLDVDHLVPLENAHDSGGWGWLSAKRREYANWLDDPDHLTAVTMDANRTKGEKGPEEWRPPDEGYWCRYAVDWTEIKERWGLTMTEPEAEAIVKMLGTCENPVKVSTETGETVPVPTPVPYEGPVYGSCEEAAEAGEERVLGSRGGGEGFPEETVPSARDGDRDGVVCER